MDECRNSCATDLNQLIADWLASQGLLGITAAWLGRLRPLQGRGYRKLFHQFLEWLLARRLDNRISLELGRHVSPNSFHGLGYLIMSAPSIDAALSEICRRPWLYHEMVHLTWQGNSECCQLVAANDATNPRLRALVNEAALAIVAHYLRWLLVERCPPLAASFSHAALSPDDDYVEVFGQRPAFGTTHCALLLPATLATAQLPSHRPELFKTLLSQLGEQHYLPRRRLADRVSELIGDAMGRGMVTRAQIARQLNVSEKTLERRLAARQLTFRQLLERQRCQRAKELLNDPELTLDAIAENLGYQDASAFSRAYKRWSGQSPRQTNC